MQRGYLGHESQVRRFSNGLVPTEARSRHRGSAEEAAGWSRPGVGGSRPRQVVIPLGFAH